MKVYIFGIGGVGKTTVGVEVAKGLRCEHISGSSLMMNLCDVKSREELEVIDPVYKNMIESITYPDYVTSTDNIIVDGHGTLTDEQINCFDIFIYLYASPEEIAERRIKRGRRGSSIDEIYKESQVYNEKFLNLCDKVDVRGVCADDCVKNVIKEVCEYIGEVEGSVELVSELKSVS